jgi:carboxymethylenebutenolidase
VLAAVIPCSFLPQIEEFSSGVAFYGFPYRARPANGTTPASHIDELEDPMLIIHGTYGPGQPY